MCQDGWHQKLGLLSSAEVEHRVNDWLHSMYIRGSLVRCYGVDPKPFLLCTY